MHAQLIVSRKKADDCRRISLMTHNRGSNGHYSQKFGQFDRLDFTGRSRQRRRLAFQQALWPENYVRNLHQQTGIQKDQRIAFLENNCNSTQCVGH